jgi:hypothetical protein
LHSGRRLHGTLVLGKDDEWSRCGFVGNDLADGLGGEKFVLLEDFGVMRSPFQKILFRLAAGQQGNTFAVFHDDGDIMATLFRGF